MSNKSGRKKFLKQLVLGGLGLGAAGWGISRFLRHPAPGAIPGEILGADAARGHRLRKADLPAPTRTREVPVLIVGAGVAGLSAAWHLERQQGRKDYLILELAEQPGGNAAFGQNEVSAYPWGAHYLPVPGPQDTAMLVLLQELGVVRSIQSDGTPVFDELHLCHTPRERLLIHGHWQEGVLPRIGVPRADSAQIQAFQAHIHDWQARSGADGNWAFRIPVDESSTEADWRALDKIDMRSYLLDQGWDSPYLHWYVNYCCRDDFGTPLAETSAWAGLHYFSARRSGGVNAAAGSVLTWPEGNGWLIRNWVPRLSGELRCNALVTRLENTSEGVEAHYYDFEAEEMVRVLAETAVFAGPQFAAPYLIPGLAADRARAFSYAPWLVANVTLRQRPAGAGYPLSWDNVAYGSDSLGYVVSDHQSITRRRREKTVITWYQPLDDQPPAEARKAALAHNCKDWQNMVVADLEKMHPGIRKDISRMDVWLWGHGMIRPVPGFIWGGAREAAAAPLGNIRFAHSDLSGISIFEEAFYQGGRAFQTPSL